MTAEIAIINKSAVALAADSKVTLSVGGRPKTFDTVDKLFSLSKTEPVGAMIYGGAEFMGFPWETVIKEYRRRNPTKRFDTIAKWADDLCQFLCTFFPFDDSDSADVIRRLGLNSIQQVFEQIQQSEMSDGPIEPSQVVAMFEAQVAALSDIPDFFDDALWSEIVRKHDAVFDEIATGDLATHFKIDPELVRDLVELAVRKDQPSTVHTGLVVAGFGEVELLPSLLAFEIDGIIDGQLKKKLYADFDTTRKKRSAIIPFAQTDMVFRFMEGIDPSFSMQLERAIADLTLSTARSTATALGKTDEEVDALMPALEQATQAQINSLLSSIRRYQNDQFSSPITDMTMSLPKDELANLAESLVSLTSLQRKVSREVETVGGAIDVAVISKGDGFVWIKRKHYFDADRNIRFVNGYFSEYGAPATRGGSDAEQG